MPLFIRDDKVDALAAEVQKTIRARSKTEAVRVALQHELDRAHREAPLRQRLAGAMAIADAMGPGDPDFDMKKFTDENVERQLMFVDASVVVAVLAREPGWEEIVKRLETEEGPFFVSPLARFEAVVALARKKSGRSGQPVRPSAELIALAGQAVEAFTAALGADEMAISSEVGSIALDAAKTYGKVVGHPADLNFGDCFAYACAKFLGVGLAYKGDDFALTDLT